MIGIPNVNSLLLCYRLLTLCILLLFARYDHRHHKVRNTALAAFLPWCLFSVPLAVLSDLTVPVLSPILSSVTGFLCGGFLLFMVSVATNGGIGGGDIKLVALLGMCYGLTGIIFILILSCMLALVCLIEKSIEKEQTENIPFVPYLAAGCLIYVVITLLN